MPTTPGTVTRTVNELLVTLCGFITGTSIHTKRVAMLLLWLKRRSFSIDRKLYTYCETKQAALECFVMHVNH
ncbi:hypothetical protein FRX31_006693 [Thalictrum thalictroides]|uniref:Uncharacterized protein n=1 Tax=Thalictrum thalictroides TaxID=46969 RepID=A0A7J6X5R4_THATH|nr:hypothetical protein FRX31_006693 [Thalictrum thalictroides]